MVVHGINRNCITKIIKIESQSVNSVLLDTDPNEYHERYIANNHLDIIYTYINVLFY